MGTRAQTRSDSGRRRWPAWGGPRPRHPPRRAAPPPTGVAPSAGGHLAGPLVQVRGGCRQVLCLSFLLEVWSFRMASQGVGTLGPSGGQGGYRFHRRPLVPAVTRGICGTAATVDGRRVSAECFDNPSPRQLQTDRVTTRPWPLWSPGAAWIVRIPRDRPTPFRRPFHLPAAVLAAAVPCGAGHPRPLGRAATDTPGNRRLRFRPQLTRHRPRLPLPRRARRPRTGPCPRPPPRP